MKIFNTLIVYKTASNLLKTQTQMELTKLFDTEKF